MNYREWINGNGCCQPTNNCGCGGKDVCNCEEILLEISKLHTDDEILQDEIDYVSGVVDTISGGCDCDLTDYYTKEESDAKFLTEHQPLKTINNQIITGTGNIEITCSGGTITVDDHLDSASTNPVQNKVITEALNGKLDASAYTPTEQVQSDWNVTDSASTAYIKNKPVIPVVPTSNSAFTNDMHYVTSAETANYVTSGNVETQIVNHFWCGTQGEWALISGNTQPNVLYLIHG